MPSVGAETRRYCPDPRSLFAGHRLDILVDGTAACAAALADKARSGTSVRVVVDGLGTFWAGDELERTLRPAGVHFARAHRGRPRPVAGHRPRDLGPAGLAPPG
jgi:hypothetical protein